MTREKWLINLICAILFSSCASGRPYLVTSKSDSTNFLRTYLSLVGNLSLGAVDIKTADSSQTTDPELTTTSPLLEASLIGSVNFLLGHSIFMFDYKAGHRQLIRQGNDFNIMTGDIRGQVYYPVSKDFRLPTYLYFGYGFRSFRNYSPHELLTKESYEKGGTVNLGFMWTKNYVTLKTEGFYTHFPEFRTYGLLLTMQVHIGSLFL